MTRLPARARPGFSFIDLLVVIAIIGVLIGLLFPALPGVGARKRQVMCTNNLKQLGLAFHTFHDGERHLPSENVDNQRYWKKLPSTHGRTSFYCYLLPYVEESRQYKMVMGNRANAGDMTKAQPIRVFVCPDRHEITETTAVALRDYGYRQSSGQKHSILDADKYLNFTIITGMNGAGQTALLTHYWWDAKKYDDPARTSKTDGWANEGYDGKTRAIDQFDTDINQPDSKPLPAKTSTAMGSPHHAGNPTLIADGSVQTIPYDPKFAGVKLFFDYTNKTAYQLP